jgi:hypothetical protein
MTVYNWLSLVGIPALFAAIVVGVYKALVGKFKRANDQYIAIKLAIQAMLRDRLYQIYHECKINNGATHIERENFNNLYVQYHALGANGVMDDTRAKFFALPIIDEE